MKELGVVKEKVRVLNEKVAKLQKELDEAVRVKQEVEEDAQ